ncbi:MAG: cell wall hydrolase [Lachnospiraceae bacterium]|nr:cell wall hydrolase [Lachnospiraceae bacterium]
MKSRNFGKTAAKALICTACAVSLFTSGDMAVAAREKYLVSLNAGVAEILDCDPDTGSRPEEAVEDLEALCITMGTGEEEDSLYDPEEELVMADVNEAANVRTEPDAGSELAGLLYKDCGGRILERKDGWTKIESGDLVGWIRDDLLFFGEEAEALADTVGFRVINVTSEALNVREEASDDADIEGIITKGDRLDIDDTVENVPKGWVAVVYDSDVTGYVREEYVVSSFRVDSGETQAAIEEREAKEAEEKRKKALHANRGAVVANADENRLLAALIQCEAGANNYPGCLAVGAVVMNRVRSGGYPNTISSVIYASGQFTPALNGKVAARYMGNISPICIQAATDAINGCTNVGGATHFRRWNGSIPGIVIANQVYY